MINLIGKSVIGYDGFSRRKGKVIGEENPKYGFKSWVIKWEDGSLDTHSKHSLKHEKDHKGIGVYWIDEVKKDSKYTIQPLIYIENNINFIQ